MQETNAGVDGFFTAARKWRPEMERLRAIALDSRLKEELKWGKPCYTFQGSNIVIIQGFKEYCALLFFKGALLQDPNGILKKTGENTQAGRQVRFTSIHEIDGLETALKAYINEAIEVEKAGLKVNFDRNPEPYPLELQIKLDEIPGLRTAFEALTPGRQRAYILHFSAAKQSQTRTARIEKCIPLILSGKGLND